MSGCASLESFDHNFASLETQVPYYRTVHNLSNDSELKHTKSEALVMDPVLEDRNSRKYLL